MELKQIFTKKKIIFLLIFFVLVLIGKKINFSPVIGAENQFFTLFEFFGPIAGSFLGPVVGIASVLLAQITDFILAGKTFTFINLARLLPMLFAVYYFSNKRKKLVTILVPLLCIASFLLHPTGRAAWIYSLFWLIPVLGEILPEKIKGRLLFKSYGATFTAHALGSVLWLYTFPMSAEQWLALIPVTAYERFLFGLGIAGSYLILFNVLDLILHKWKLNVPAKVLFLDKKYLLNWFR